MALGDYTKTTYNNGATPAINATNLNNSEDKIKELDNEITLLSGEIDTHEANITNPHAVTKAQVGLGSVDNVKQLPLAGGTMTGSIVSKGTAGAIKDAGAAGSFEVRGASSLDGAFMSFHRPSAYAANIGIDTDNKWKVGGWSMGVNSHELWHAGNTPQTRISNGEFQALIGGVWESVGGTDWSKYEPVYLKSPFTVSSANVYQSAINIVGKGYSNFIKLTGGSNSTAVDLKIIKDGVVIYEARVNTAGYMLGIVNTHEKGVYSSVSAKKEYPFIDTSLSVNDEAVMYLDTPMFFNNSLDVQAKCTTTSNMLHFAFSGGVE